MEGRDKLKNRDPYFAKWAPLFPYFKENNGFLFFYEGNNGGSGNVTFKIIYREKVGSLHLPILIF